MKAQLNEEQEERVAQLRKLVKPNLTDYYDTDFNLLRWLQGHPGSVESVAEKLNEHLRARLNVRFVLSFEIVHLYEHQELVGFA
uniref:Uncharacterized protein n=1 Tax=Parascaris equorum TaxID=6256 RepID=A0A914RBZ3_PAREQ